MSRVHVTCTVNGDETEFLCDGGQSLLNALRDEVGLIGAKEGCGTGDCGSCSIIMDGRLTCSCLVLAPEAQGRSSTPSRAWPPATTSTPSSSASWRARPCSAGCVRRGS